MTRRGGTKLIHSNRKTTAVRGGRAHKGTEQQRMPEWAISIEKTATWVKKRPFKASLLIIVAIAFAILWNKVDYIPEKTRFVISGLLPFQSVPLESISWNGSIVGDRSLPSGSNGPITLSAQASSWPHASKDGDLPKDMSTFPRLTYAMSDDFDATTSVRIYGEPTFSGGVRLAGIGILSRENNQMLVLGRSLKPGDPDVRAFIQEIHPNGPAAPFLGQTYACNSDVVRLKITKHRSSIGLFCKGSGRRWIPVRLGGDFANVIGEKVSEVFLFAYAADKRPVKAAFLDFAVRQR